jgi:GNAT superfamily N-acetyltransferase
MTTARPVDVDVILDLRARVLRSGTTSADPTFPEDRLPTTAHFAVTDESTGAVIACGSVFPSPCPTRPDAPAMRLRGMATEPTIQRGGLGTAVVDAIVGWSRERGAELVWANARDTALGFYRARSFSVEGEGFINDDTGLPHHLVTLDLS